MKKVEENRIKIRKKIKKIWRKGIQKKEKGNNIKEKQTNRKINH